MVSSRPTRTAIEVVGALATTLALYYGLVLLSTEAVRAWVSSVPGVTKSDLVADFQGGAAVALGVTAGLLALWFGWTHVAGVVRPASAGKRTLWVVIGATALVASLGVCVALFEQPLVGDATALAVVAVAVAALYYLPTALFTAASFKYSAPGSPWLRGRLPF